MSTKLVTILINIFFHDFGKNKTKIIFKEIFHKMKENLEGNYNEEFKDANLRLMYTLTST